MCYSLEKIAFCKRCFHYKVKNFKWCPTLWICLDITYFIETENWKYCSKIIFKCVNSVVKPTFNEKWLKSEVVGPVNSVRMHCSLENSQKLWLLFMNSAWIVAVIAQVPLKCSFEKKKKKKKKSKTQMQNSKCVSKPHLCVLIELKSNP